MRREPADVSADHHLGLLWARSGTETADHASDRYLGKARHPVPGFERNPKLGRANSIARKLRRCDGDGSHRRTYKLRSGYSDDLEAQTVDEQLPAENIRIATEPALPGS